MGNRSICLSSRGTGKYSTVERNLRTHFELILVHDSIHFLFLDTLIAAEFSCPAMAIALLALPAELAPLATSYNFISPANVPSLVPPRYPELVTSPGRRGRKM